LHPEIRKRENQETHGKTFEFCAKKPAKKSDEKESKGVLKTAVLGKRSLDWPEKKRAASCKNGPPFGPIIARRGSLPQKRLHVACPIAKELPSLEKKKKVVH